MTKEPHVYTPAHDPGRQCPVCGRGGRPFADYIDQPDTASRARQAVLSIPFALPEKKIDPEDIRDEMITDEEWQEWGEWPEKTHE